MAQATRALTTEQAAENGGNNARSALDSRCPLGYWLRMVVNTGPAYRIAKGDTRALVGRGEGTAGASE